MATKRSLKDVLASTDDVTAAAAEDELDLRSGDVQMSTVSPENALPPGQCIECGDQPSELHCKECDEEFCEVCFKYLHRTGKRKLHCSEQLRILGEAQAQGKGDAPSVIVDEQENAAAAAATALSSQPEDDLSSFGSDKTLNSAQTDALKRFRNNVRFIPMRLTLHERKLFRLLEAALEVSQYTDKVDILYSGPKARRIVSQLREMCTVLTGLVVANGLEDGQALMENKEFVHHAEWFQRIFEIGRRYKIQNPEKMRTSFGKLMYMIMDSRLPEIRETMEFDLYSPILTVFDVLEQGGALAMLDDPLILPATLDISALNKTRDTIQRQIRQKEAAIEHLARKYQQKDNNLSSESIRQALYSIGDYHAYLSSNRAPVLRMLEYLEDNFSLTSADVPEKDLHIAWGQNGARLSHSHQEQCQYVRQSLTLWSEIMREMYHLWKLADDDLTSSDYRYRLADTGQGLNRIKPCPKVNHMMHVIIQRAQVQVGSWIGSAVVHLGDHTVPNALFFLDKYLQVPRILNPIGLVIGNLPSLARDPHAQAWISSQYGSVEQLIQVILVDFFRHAFDGSGANNFYDAGSCIDGRLTSAWHWANSISKKPYYKFFLVSGFTGFDGEDGF